MNLSKGKAVYVTVCQTTESGLAILLGRKPSNRYVLPFKTGQKLIELGGGDRPCIRPNLDIRPMATVDIVADFNKPLPLPDASYDGVFSKFAMEHISHRNVKQFISEIFRVLRPCGYAVICTANLLEQAKVIVAQKNRVDFALIGLIFGNQDFPENSHKSSMTPAIAKKCFEEARFVNVKIVPVSSSYCCGSKWPVDMIIEARKPIKNEVKTNGMGI